MATASNQLSELITHKELTVNVRDEEFSDFYLPHPYRPHAGAVCRGRSARLARCCRVHYPGDGGPEPEPGQRCPAGRRRADRPAHLRIDERDGGARPGEDYGHERP